MRLGKAICAAAAAWIGAVASSASALETDQFYAWGKPLTDSTEAINAKVNLELNAALGEVNLRGDRDRLTCDAVFDGIVRHLRYFLFQQIENWAVTSADVARVPAGAEQVEDFRKRYLYGPRPGGDVILWMPASPTIEVADVRIGTDKLNHFFSQGLWLHRTYRRARRKGADAAEAESHAILRGLLVERTILGMGASGVLSRADLEANSQGMHFYNGLCEAGSPALQRDASGWRMSRPFDLRDYVTPEWDESYQLSLFTRKRWKKVRPALERYCALLSSDEVRQQRERYRTRDRVTASERAVESLVAEGKLPHPSEFDIETVCGEALRGVAAGAGHAALGTVAEHSGYTSTGRYDEVLTLSATFEKAFPGRVRSLSFGVSPEGRPMLALVASDDGVLEPADARARARPVVFVQGGIHAGEIDGKDAGFEILRSVLEGNLARGVLSKITLVFVPVFNVDGHERFGPHQRVHQRGPRETGWRTTAQNLNLNRDYAKAEAPEMQAMLRFLAAWDPVLLVDLHVTDGAKFRHDVAVLVDPGETPGHPLQAVARQLRDRVLERLEAGGHHPLGFYPAFTKEDDPASGFAVGSAPPRISNAYWAWRDRLGLLVETHSWRTYGERVRATRAVLAAVLERAEEEASIWRDAVRQADESARVIGGKEVVLAWSSGEEVVPIDFLGYAYDQVFSAVSGKARIVYREDEPSVWRVPLRVGLTPSLSTRAPRGGYVVPAAWADGVEQKLSLHGLRVERLRKAVAEAEVEVYRFRDVTFAGKPYEGRMTAVARGSWVTERRALAEGSLFVPIAQPGARLLVHLLEPEAPDSLVSWGFFNAVFERKEYMEDYVAEEVAEAMLRADPGLRDRFEADLASDPSFAADPGRRLEFFARLHPSWDERKDVYPVLRVDSIPEPSP